MSALRQPAANGVGPWGRVPLWITKADISDRAVRLFAFYSGSDTNGDGSVHWSLAATDRALHWGTGAAKRARQELLSIGAIGVEPRLSKGGRLPDAVTLNFTQPEAKRALVHPPKRAPVLPNYTDKSTDGSGTKRRRKRIPPSKALAVTDQEQESTSAPLALSELDLALIPDDDDPEDDEEA